jgi:hypothetical protein
MKNPTKLLLVSALMIIMVIGCSDFLDINVDPNNPTSAPIEGLMTNTTFETALNTHRVAGTTSFFVQHFASPNEASSSDVHESTSYGTIWSNLYFNIDDLLVLIEQADELNASYYSGIARVMAAYNLGLLVNMFGDVPYSDGFSDETLQPEYDTSESIYEEIFNLLEEGIADLQAPESTVIPGGDDFIFSGDLEAWTRTAYALQARFLNHYSKQPDYDRDAVLNAVDNAFTSNDEDFQMEFFDEGLATENPWYRLALNNSNLLLGGWLSDQFVDHLNGETYGVMDPRIEFITEEIDDGGYVGTRNGAGRGAASEQGDRSVLAVSSWYADSPTNPLLMATYAEMKFIEAEAALTVDPERAYQAYEEGIRAHMEKLGVDQADIEAYWNNPVVSVGSGSLTIDEIMKEKYVAMFLTPEAWNDARRYNYSYQGFQIPANHNPALNGEMIRLVRYPDSELQRNAGNVPDRTMLDRVFWDEE